TTSLPFSLHAALPILQSNSSSLIVSVTRRTCMPPHLELRGIGGRVSGGPLPVLRREKPYRLIPLPLFISSCSDEACVYEDTLTRSEEHTSELQSPDHL